MEGIEVENWEMKVVIWEGVRREKMIRRRGDHFEDCN